jgi:hypothetical protein
VNILNPLLLLAALVCFIVAAIVARGEPVGLRRPTFFIALGLAFWVADLLIGVFWRY